MQDPVQNPDEAPVPLPASLVALKWLVIALTASMILGVLAIVGILATRLPAPGGAAVDVSKGLPATIVLPEGSRARAVTVYQGGIGVLTEDDRFLIYTPEGVLRSTTAIRPATGG